MPKKRASETVGTEEIRKAIEDYSGYPFEMQIARRIGATGYLVDPNYSFEDQDIGVARELDFHAIGVDIISARTEEFLWVVVLGSCKDNRNPYVFFTRESILSGITLDSDLPIAGRPLKVYPENDDWSDLGWYLGLHKLLHIATTPSVSSQFCQLVRKSSKWQVQAETIFKDIFVPLIKALSREIQDYNERCVPTKGDESLNYQIYYPLLVFKGPMFEYYVPTNGPAEVRPAQHIVVIRDYQSKTVKCRYAFDAIHESYLEQYLQLVDWERTRLRNLIKRHKKLLVQSVKKIAQQEEKNRG